MTGPRDLRLITKSHFPRDQSPIQFISTIGAKMNGDTGNKTAFVLGGGGALGGYEVGMLRALLEAGIHPDLIVGTSIGSIQGAMAAADPTLSGVTAMTEMWVEFVTEKVMKTSPLHAASNMVHSHSHYGSSDALHKLVVECLGEQTRFEDLTVPFQCAATSIEKCAARYFDSGPLVPAVMASCAVPGLWPAVELDGQHFFDGGLVDSIPIGRAIELGASLIYVLHVGRIEQPLKVPNLPWEVASVCFEISRRHGFMDVMNTIPEGVTVHVMPSGEDPDAPHHKKLLESTSNQLKHVFATIDHGYVASAEYLRTAAIS